MSTDVAARDIDAVLAESASRQGIASQATMVEQSRAIAEVQAAVVVAQRCPRDVSRAEGEMRDACGRYALAKRAFYRVPNRGHGPSVHLARELARVWGNVQYGVHELRRDDTAGESEIQAFAWDLQTNTRSTRTFIVPHQRMAGGKRKPLVDLTDVYLNNQNVGARAVRECIFTVLPDWFTDTAEETCRATLENGEGKPLPQRIDDMVRAFAERYGVSQQQMEARLARKRGQWDAGDVASMTVTYQSIQRGEVTVDEEFPSARPSAADFTTPAEPAPVADVTGAAVVPDADEWGPVDITTAQRRAMFAAFTAAGFDTDARSTEGRQARLDYIGRALGRVVESTNDLTKREAGVVLDMLASDAQKVGAEPEEPQP